MVEPKSLKDIDWDHDDLRLIAKSIAFRQQAFEKLIVELIGTMTDSIKAINQQVNSQGLVTDSILKERMVDFETFMDGIFKDIEKSGVKH